MDYDPRYLAGVLLFNEGDYFEAHEVWEDLWSESHGNDRRFFQGLIQAAVGLCHFGNGNLGGAAKLYRSSLDYLKDLGDNHFGLNLAEFRSQMEECFRPLLGDAPPARSERPREHLLPNLRLFPAPTIWQLPSEYRSTADDD